MPESTGILPGNDAAEGCSCEPDGMAWIPSGTFAMGSDRHYREEAPVHQVAVDGFWIDTHPVTNAKFASFVAGTGYVTIAERPLDPADYPGAVPDLLTPGALVFHKPTSRVDLGDVQNWWAYVPGACWRQPEGPQSTISGREHHPVVHVAYADAEAYAGWAGKSLPTEAEWEVAARGGLKEADYCWGEEFSPGGRMMANTWQGEFPWQNLMLDGYEGTAPVGSFPPNGYGLYDMAGNVWEWTSDWYAARHPADSGKPCCVPLNPRGPSREGSYDPAQPAIRIPRRVVKGGSFLCAPNYCQRYRPAARQPQMLDSAMSHIGFRCVIREGERR
jgi:formylglycine-generating enzyme